MLKQLGDHKHHIIDVRDNFKTKHKNRRRFKDIAASSESERAFNLRLASLEANTVISVNE